MMSCPMQSPLSRPCTACEVRGKFMSGMRLIKGLVFLLLQVTVVIVVDIGERE